MTRKTAKAALSLSVFDLGFSLRTVKVLSDLGITKVHHLVTRTEQDFKQYKNFGKSSMAEIKSTLIDLELGLGMKPSYLRKLKQ